jgi:putative SOS response-associated peptidase YedK
LLAFAIVNVILIPPYVNIICYDLATFFALPSQFEISGCYAGEWVRGFAIITTRPNELCAELHDRMPVVLGPAAWPVWLGEEPTELSELKALLAPYPTEEMTCWPVSVRVGNVKNNDPSLIEPIAAE